MSRLLIAFLIMLAPALSFADDFKPDDVIVTTLSAEGWVTTKTARVSVAVNAAVTAANTGTMRDAMMKAVQQLGPKGEWRITSFNRSQDQTGMEQWFANFEARLLEADLGGLHEKAKAASKPGMQLSIANVDFTPTLEEVEAVRAGLRKTIMDMAVKELANVNATLPGPKYRLSSINFSGLEMPNAQPRIMMMKAMADGAVAESGGAAPPPVETAQRLHITAQVSFSALAPTGEEPAAKK